MLDNGSSLGFSPEQESLRQRVSFLRDRLSALASEYETATQVEAKNLRHAYYENIGYLEAELLGRQLESARYKREITLITAATNRGQSPDFGVIEEQLEQEFHEWRERLQAEKARVEAARQHRGQLLGPEESKRIQDQYRKLVKELHPDVHPERHPACRALWERLQVAYQNSDYAEMDLVELLLAKDELPEEMPATVLAEEVKRLTKRCGELVERLAVIRREPPLSYRDLLDDPEALQSRRKEVQQAVEAETARRDQLRAHLDGLLDGLKG